MTEPLDSAATSATEANARRWSADDDAWRGYKRVGGKLVLEDRVALTLDLVVPRRDGAYLDVGCGPGVITKLIGERIGAARIAGVDQLDRSSGIEFRAFDLDAPGPLPFDDRTFDVVSCLETLEHVHDTDHLVTEIGRVLRPDGYALISVPRIDSVLTILMLAAGLQPPAIECSLRRRYGAPDEPERVSGHVSHFTRKALFSLLEANGFRVEAEKEASIYSGWLLAQARPPLRTRLPLWLLDKVRLKKDCLIVRVRPRR